MNLAQIGGGDAGRCGSLRRNLQSEASPPQPCGPGGGRMPYHAFKAVIRQPGNPKKSTDTKVKTSA